MASSSNTPTIPAVPGHPAPLAPAPADTRWSVRLLGTVQADGAGLTLLRWPSRAVAALLARLALAPDRAHPREELIELLWPGVAITVGRNRLRQALSTLKGLLEPPGPHAAQVLQADRQAIRLRPGTVACDARQFEALVRTGRADAARALYHGELMPGHYEDWVLVERARLAGLVEQLDAAHPLALLAPSRPAQRGLDTMPAAGAGAGVSAGVGAGTRRRSTDNLAEDRIAPTPTGLPSYWTRPFGADLTASRLRALVQTQRLVTVHGPGGSGKTRLAVAVAQALRDAPEWAIGRDAQPPRFDRIVFVPLVQCTSAEQALDAICDALRGDSAAGGPGDVQARIVATLAGHHVLLVLDNLEQLADDAGSQITRLLSAAPGLHVLVTSRRLLAQDGEIAFALDGLALPAVDATLDDAAATPAVALFVDRARASRADFRLGARHCSAIVALVRLLGGMPLAIELAASRVRSLSPQELLQRLSDGAGTPMLDLLARNTLRATADSRHASMRHVVDWSWQQLDAAQQHLLLSLSVLTAPARTDMVAAMLATGQQPTQALLDELHDASLVQRSEGADHRSRHGLLQPVREFAAERCPPALQRTARQRQRQWLIQFAGTAAAQGPQAVAPELAHVHAALISAPADGAGPAALALALALRNYWDADSLPLAAVLALEQSLATLGEADTTAGLRTDALELLALGRSSAGFAEQALAHAEAGLASAQDDRRRCLALVRWVSTMYYAGRYQAASDASLDNALDQASVLARRCGDRVAQATVLRLQGLIACNLRLDFAGAEALVAQAQQLWEQLGNRRMAYAALLNRATAWAWTGRNEEAVTVFEECERAALADGDWISLMQVRWQIGRVMIRLRRWDDAATAFRRSIRIGWQRHYPQALANAMLHLPEALVMAGQAERAARLQGFVVGHWLRLYRSINRIETRELRRTRLLLHLQLGAARAEALRAEGSSLGLADAVALALAPD